MKSDKDDLKIIGPMISSSSSLKEGEDDISRSWVKKGGLIFQKILGEMRFFHFQFLILIYHCH